MIIMVHKWLLHYLTSSSSANATFRHHSLIEVKWKTGTLDSFAHLLDPFLQLFTLRMNIFLDVKMNSLSLVALKPRTGSLDSRLATCCLAIWPIWRPCLRLKSTVSTADGCRQMKTRLRHSARAAYEKLGAHVANFLSLFEACT